jgi:hypothetical protein
MHSLPPSPEATKAVEASKHSKPHKL